MVRLETPKPDHPTPGSGAPTADVILRLTGVTKRFGSVAAVREQSLEVRAGEVFTLLGPSGCGKTTTLRLVAGLERPDAGEIICRGKTLVSVSRREFVPPFRRNFGMVFQSYAIWPHLTVFENVAYPLRVRRLGRDTIAARVRDTLHLVGLDGLESRPAPLLSGGQQQRVAIARALVYEPDLLLLDEPFSNLDAKLRERMRLELRQLQRRVGITVLFVTHDQIEALSLSDRIVVMNEGRCEQMGTPRELYERAATPFVRDFLGRTIVLRGQVAEATPSGAVTVQVDGSGQLVAETHLHDLLPAGAEAWLTVRPEDVEVEPAQDPMAPGRNTLPGVIDTLLFLGDRYESQIQLEGGQTALLYLPRSLDWTEGQAVRLRFPRERLSVWPT
jgi:ABC-type Fe3+/spermidine/putrescine transport system ATPase subunit